MKWKNTKNHWSKRQNRNEILKKISESKKKNPTKYWTGKKHSPETIKKISKNRSGKNTGNKNQNWKGGITQKHNRLRGSLEYIIWRNSVYKRDNWHCKICKKHCEKGDIIAHHLKKFADFPELRFDTDNGITLCRKCHIEVESPNITHT